jgi:acyl carrier protein
VPPDSLSEGRRLLMDFSDAPDVIADTPDDADLVAAGLNSGDLIRLALAIEERTGAALGDDELPLLHTIAGIDRILAGRAGRVPAESD